MTRTRIPSDIALDTDCDTAAGRLQRMAWSCEGVNEQLANDIKAVLLQRDQLIRCNGDLEAKLTEAKSSNEQLDLGLRERARLVAVRGLKLMTDRWAA